MGINSQRNSKAKKMMNKPEGKFEQIDLSITKNVPKWCTRAFANNKFMITINDNAPTTKGVATRVMVQKFNDTPILNHWSEMQRIKNEIFGKETVAVEYYPKESELVNEKNIYWMWIFNNNELPIPINQ